MKNFTLLLFMLLFSFGLSAKNSSELQKKIQQKQEKISEMTRRKAKLNNFLNLTGSEAFLKSAAATQKLDSTVNLVLNDETQLWQNDYKDEYYYDSELKSTFWLSKEWDINTKTWDSWFKTEWGYDNQDRFNSMLMYDRDSLTQALTPNSKFLIFYHSDGTQDSTLSFSTETAGASWILDMKQINHYNASKQLIKADIWMWDEDLGEITLSENIVYTYTTAGKIKSSSTSYVFEGDEMLWSKIEYNYDGSDRLTSIEYSTTNFMTFALEKTSRDTYQYNASGKVSVEIYSSWNGTSWDDMNKTVYEYNAAGDVSVEIYSTWNGTAWVEEEKYEYTYSNTNFSDVVFPFFNFLIWLNETTDFSYNKVITGENLFEMVNGSWKNTEKFTYYYSGGTSTNINEFENSVVNVYPNPASEAVNFSWKGNHEALSLQIYQITGAKVIEQTVYSGRPVTISHLENGVYLYKLLNGQQNVKTGKMIKR